MLALVLPNSFKSPDPLLQRSQGTASRGSGLASEVGKQPGAGRSANVPGRALEIQLVTQVKRKTRDL